MDHTGAPVTGIDQTDILGAAVTVIRGDSTKTTVSVTGGGNWVEVNTAKAPGLYTVDIGPAPSIDGPFQISVVPAATAFSPNVVSHEVLNTAPDLALAGNIVGGKSTIVVGADAILTAYDSVPNPVKSWKITGATGSPDGDHPYTRTPQP